MTRTARRGTAHVGCSGWMYRDWRGVIYPAGLASRHWFAHYAAHFDTVELNTTFYRLPLPQTADAWGAQAPPGFTYALKLGQFGSHRMKLRDAASWLPNHVDRARRLGAASGPTLVQLPPRWRVNAERLAEFFSVAPRDMRWALELRDPSWLDDSVYAVLREHGVALCIHDLIGDHPWVRTADWTYVRFHGPDARTRTYFGRYGPARLAPFADRLRRWLDEGCDVYAYFNNDWHGHAWPDALDLRAQLAPGGPGGPGVRGVPPVPRRLTG